MEYSSFEIQNFKGIEHAEIDLSGAPGGSIFTLVGLNESGKTTVLEAIGYFQAKEKHLESLYDDDYRHGDVHDLIPMKKKANFNESVVISATLKFSSLDKSKISQFARTNVEYVIEPPSISDYVTIRTEVRFASSNYQGTNNYWTLELPGKTNRGRKVRELLQYDKEKWMMVIGFIREQLPSILYFPTFLFEFPSRIYLQPDDEESSTNVYYREIIQDILDSLNDGLEIKEHIVDRVLDGGYFKRRSLESVLNKMSNVITKTVFERWNEVFDRKIPRKDIVVQYDIEEGSSKKEGHTGEPTPRVYLQFMLKDGDSIYLITERSLGFRWFFCFLLFTQFRQHRRLRTDTLFLFDEPASNLHSKAQTQLIGSFAKITEASGKIVYSTHSHYMINPQWLENAYIVRNEGLRYDEVERDYDYSSQDTEIKLVKYRQFVGENSDKVTYFQPILDTLDYAPSTLEFVSDAVFLEGKNDYYLITYFGKSDVSFVPGFGASGLDTAIALYLGWGRDFIILLDADKEGRRNRERYLREWLLKEEQVFTLADIDSAWTGKSTS